MNRARADRNEAPPPGGSPDDTAADWLARREAGLTAGEQAEFSRWLLADPRHAAAARELEASWQRMRRPRLAGQAAAVAQAIAVQEARRGNRRRRRRLTIGVAVSTLAAAAAWILIVSASPSPRSPATAPSPVASVTVRPERRLLDDGSEIELNAGADVRVEYTEKLRAVRLVAGEALFKVAKNPARPFVVTAGAVSVRAVGTAFVVRLEPEHVGVLVTEGRVAVGRDEASATAEPTFLGAGAQLTLPAQAVAVAGAARPRELTEEEMRAALAWRGRRIEFTRTPLAEAVALFNRQNRVQLVLGDERLGSLEISGIFWADDPEGFSRLAAVSAELVVEHPADGRIVLRR